ncbi:MAG: DUF5706 domain-containing protein [Bacteroidia bacterium]
METTTALHDTAQYASRILAEQLPPGFVFHNLERTKQIIQATQTIADYEKLSGEELEIALTGAWFHDTGYRDAHEDHREKSKAIAAAFLEERKIPAELADRVLACIMATAGDAEPQSKAAKVLLDAIQKVAIEQDHKNLPALSRELQTVYDTEQPEVKILQDYLEAIVQTTFYTTYGQEVLQPARNSLKAKLEKKLKKLQKAMDEQVSTSLGITEAQLKALKKKLEKAEGRPERGIETMFRLTSKNHLDLSGMADSKANIMISINSIIMSFVMASLLSKIDSNPYLYYPTILLLLVNLTALIFAILALRPNVSDGRFTREDIENQNTNLLFFGNFHKMSRTDYHWGMNKLMENANFLYSNLIDDIYFLGVVLARKYTLLRISYNVFMYGMIVVVIAYIISLRFAEVPISDVLDTLQK